jgi:quercetin dioxygenase-like cupin family protein
MTPDGLLRPGDGETITRKERREVVLLAARHEIAITWSRYAAGEQGPDLHVHREHVDAFYVLDGELTFLVGPEAERLQVAAGGFVAVPPNVVHTFVNDGGGEVRWLNVHAPDQGFAQYLRAARDGEDAAFDNFGPPADGGRPAADATVSAPGEGERVASGSVLLKAVLPELCVAEWTVDALHLLDDGARADRFYELPSTGILGIHAPDAGLSDRLRRAPA